MRRFILLFLVSGVIMLTPFSASAANFFGPIVPPACNCPPGSDGNPSAIPSAPDWGCALQIIQNLMNFAISMGVIIVTLVMAYAGILWITSPMNAHNREEGRTMLINAVIGLIITLSAWLLVDFVMKALYNQHAYDGVKAEVGPWHSILGGNVDKLCFDTSASSSLGGLGGTGGLSTTTGGSKGSGTPSTDEVAMRAKLKDAGISINTPDQCPPGVTYQDYLASTGRHCTTVKGLQSKTVDQAILIADTCGAYEITGGNELGHSEGGTGSHSSGAKIDVSSGLSSCIRQHATQSVTPPSFGSEQRKDSCGNIYTFEGDHWDINVAQACSASW